MTDDITAPVPLAHRPIDSPVRAQLAALLDHRLAVPVGQLLDIDLSAILRDRIHAQAGDLAARLCSDDPALADETARAVLNFAWPGGAVTDRTWWQTPIGQACAKAAGYRDMRRTRRPHTYPNPDAITYRQAADILGVTPGTVNQLVARRDIDRHPDGGLARASVLARKARLDAKRSQ